MSKSRPPTPKYLPADPASGGDDEASTGSCRCPACGATYDTAEQAPCRHMVTDWCFSVESEPGTPRGFWPTEGGEKLLVDFEVAVGRLEGLLSDSRRQSRKALLDMLPPHLRPRPKDHGSIPWSDLLGQRVVAAPGYLGTHAFQTDSMASDAWDVHWAQDARAAASYVEALFRDDLAAVRAVIEQARARETAGGGKGA